MFEVEAVVNVQHQNVYLKQIIIVNIKNPLKMKKFSFIKKKK